jgi:hypothetical protein
VLAMAGMVAFRFIAKNSNRWVALMGETAEMVATLFCMWIHKSQVCWSFTTAPTVKRLMANLA